MDCVSAPYESNKVEWTLFKVHLSIKTCASVRSLYGWISINSLENERILCKSEYFLGGAYDHVMLFASELFLALVI